MTYKRIRPITNKISFTTSTQLLDLLDKYEHKVLTATERLEDKHIPYGVQAKRIIINTCTQEK